MSKQVWGFALFLLLPGLILADATTGDFFGYKIGDIYPVSNKTRVVLNRPAKALNVTAENPIKPNDVGYVIIAISLKGHTILHITSYTEFESYEDAKKFLWKYKEILKAKYKIDWERIEAEVSQILYYEADVNENYRLVIGASDMGVKGTFVAISCNPLNQLKDNLQKLARVEYDQKLLEETAEKNMLDGL